MAFDWRLLAFATSIVAVGLWSKYRTIEPFGFVNVDPVTQMSTLANPDSNGEVLAYGEVVDVESDEPVPINYADSYLNQGRISGPEIYADALVNHPPTLKRPSEFLRTPEGEIDIAMAQELPMMVKNPNYKNHAA